MPTICDDTKGSWEIACLPCLSPLTDSRHSRKLLLVYTPKPDLLNANVEQTFLALTP